MSLVTRADTVELDKVGGLKAMETREGPHQDFINRSQVSVDEQNMFNNIQQSTQAEK